MHAATWRADMHSLAGRIVDRRPTIEWEPP
jgi:hypothetical protein